MIKIAVNNIKDLNKKFDSLIISGREVYQSLEHISINFDISFPLEIGNNNSTSFVGKGNVLIRNCDFKNEITFHNDQTNYIFEDCHFNDITANDITFKGKIRFRNCTFHKKVRLVNVVFDNLADFWSSQFKDRVIFYKVDFEKTVVFSSAKFYNNVLFTHTKISDRIIFRGTIFKKGIDLSLAILIGELSIFDIELNDFPTINHSVKKLEYEQCINIKGDILQKNKRETYRILKKQLIDQKNTIDASKFSFLEKKTLRKELWNKVHPKKIIKSLIISGRFYPYKTLLKIKKNRSSLSNYIILFLNRISNQHGTSYFSGIFFTCIVGAIFYYFSIIGTTRYSFAFSINWLIIEENIYGYFQFLIPTHKFNYLNSIYDQNELKSGFYIWDIIGRIFISYGIYQTIQAFRKYK